MFRINSYHPFAIITIIFWSLAYVFTRITINYFSPFSLGFLRYLIAAFSLLIVAIAFKIKIPDKKDLKWFVFSGLSGFSLYIIAFNKGSETISASMSSIIIATVPVITALLAKFVYKENIKLIQYFAIIIQFLGVVILSTKNGSLILETGIIWLLIAALLLSIYNILQRKLTKKYTALQATIYSIIIGEILLFGFLPEAINEFQHIPLNQYIYVMFLGIFSTAIAYISWTKAISKANEISSVSNYMFLTPFLTSIFGIVIINEKLDIKTIIGGIIILLGMFVFYIGKSIGNKSRVHPNFTR